MEPPELKPENPWRRAGMAAAVLVLYALAVFGMHALRGALGSGFGSFDDEPSHLVTGLMFRDYIAAGFPGSPRAFAENYYVHYPKVGIGQWPPVFYGIQGLWMLAFGESARSLIALMSLLTAGIATAVFAVLRRRAGTLPAFLYGGLLCALPLVQRMGSVIMTEIPLALFCLLATWQFSRFLATERARHSLAFAGFSILAILTKGNALALGLVPPIAIALAGRWPVLRRPSLWIAGALVACCTGPWYWLTLKISAGTWAGGSTPTLAYATRAARIYGAELFALAGIACALCALVGIAARPAPRDERCDWASTIALIAALLAFHIAIPSSIETRHLTLLAAPWILCVAYGERWLVERRATYFRALAHVAPLLLVAAFALERFTLPPKDNQGYRQAVAQIASIPELDASHVLIASDSMGEGLFVAAGAQSGERPDKVLLRGSKVLGSSTWMGLEYEPAFANGTEMMAYLRELPVGVIAFDHSTRERQWFEHMDTLLALLEGRPDLWQPMGEFDVFRDGVHYPRALRLFRQVGHEALPAKPLDFRTLYNKTF